MYRLTSHIGPLKDLHVFNIAELISRQWSRQICLKIIACVLGIFCPFCWRIHASTNFAISLCLKHIFINMLMRVMNQNWLYNSPWDILWVHAIFQSYFKDYQRSRQTIGGPGRVNWISVPCALGFQWRASVEWIWVKVMSAKISNPMICL